MNKDVMEAHAFFRRNRLDIAENLLLKRLNEDFDDCDALYLLGTIYFAKNMTGLAAQMFSRGIMLNSNRFDFWNNLGNCFKTINRDEDSRMCWEKALTIPGRQPLDYADVWNNFATPYVNSGRPTEGLQFVEKALEIVPDHASALWNMALMELEQGHYEKGFRLYESGFRTNNRMFRNYGEQIPTWDGSPGKNIIVWGEQGMGDEILFSSMIPELMKISNKVIFDCHPRLVTLFKTSFPGLIVHGTRKDELLTWPQEHKDMNAKVAIGDLGKLFRKNVSDFPNHEGYLKAKPERVEYYRKKLAKMGPRPKIGISWTGGYTKTRKDYRTIPLQDWRTILQKDADFISLQYTPEAYNTICDIEDKMDVQIRHWPQTVNANDYHETAALVSALDLVITVNTSIHHLAGALGKKCWTLTPVGKAWRYWSPDEDGHSVPWYPSVYQYQQQKMGDWKHILDRVTHDLKDFLENHDEDKLCYCGERNDGLISVSQPTPIGTA